MNENELVKKSEETKESVVDPIKVAREAKLKGLCYKDIVEYLEEHLKVGECASATRFDILIHYTKDEEGVKQINYLSSREVKDNDDFVVLYPIK